MNTINTNMMKISHIECRRWNRNVYGNTYHTATIHYADGKTAKSDVSYGYGEHCLHTAIEFAGLAKNAYDVAPYSRFLREHGITFSIIDVPRKRDL